jgi:protein O-GlcNAc transferase
MATTAEALALAGQYLQAGQRAAAEQVCRQVLQADPASADALRLLGLLAHQAGNFNQAIACYREALRLRPGLAEVHNSLGAALAARGQLPTAIASFQEAVRLRTDYAEAHDNLGTALRLAGRFQEAEAAYREALELRANSPQAHLNLGMVLALQGRFPQAVASFQTALRHRPDFVEAYMKLGDVLKQEGRLDDAEAAYRSALRLRADLADPHHALGVLLTERGQFAAAQDSLQAALRLRPGFAGAHHYLGYLYQRMGRADEAEARYREAIRLGPVLPQFHNNLGLLLADRGRLTEAVASFKEALRLQPDFAGALNNLGKCYVDQGRPEDALVCYRQAAALDPEAQFIQSNMLHLLHYPASYDPDLTFAEHQRWGRQVEQSLAKPRPVFTAPRDPQRRLRVGYVSGDFRDHVVGRYSEAVITAHDRSQFEVFCYPTVRDEDARTRRIQTAADHWYSLADLSDAEAVSRIIHDQIDLLVDLAGHTARNRLRVFARKPAPVLVSHYGYPDTTGLTAIDCRLTDPYCDPPGRTEHLHTEKVVRLPEAHWCYAPPPTHEVTPLPAQQAGDVTFASFSNEAKVTDWMIGLWARILGELPNSRLVVQTRAPGAEDERIRAAFAQRGFGPARVTLVPRAKSDVYYQRYQQVDICLDTYPYTGNNTTADSLWMGVPVITLAGPTCLTRLGVSALVLAGLEDLVTETPEGYVKAAVDLAHDLPRLRELRAQLRDRVQRTLGDVERFTRQLETAYREMWRAYCSQAGG